MSLLLSIHLELVTALDYS